MDLSQWGKLVWYIDRATGSNPHIKPYIRFHDNLEVVKKNILVITPWAQGVNRP